MGRHISLVAVSVACLAIVSCARPSRTDGAQAGGRQLKQYSTYGTPITEGNGAAVDNNVGWSSNDDNGFSVFPADCTGGQVQCHGRKECVDLSNNSLYCGSCDTNCDFYTQFCQGGQCVCKTGFSPCATYGDKCLDAESCPPGPAPVETGAPAPQGSIENGR